MLFFNIFRNDPKILKIKGGEVLFREGDPGEVMYILLAGQAEITLGGMLIEICNAGTVVGELAVIDCSPRSATVTAVTDCELAIVDQKRFHFLMDETPQFAISVMKVLAERLKLCDQRLVKAYSENPPAQ
jgi:CRP/FNR family cyclic AMP-dependent transcriptional regulator